MKEYLAQAAKSCSWLALFVVLFYLIFRLPYLFPNKNPTSSLSYAFGFNNLLAMLGVLFAVVVVSILARALTTTQQFSVSDLCPKTSSLSLSNRQSKVFWLYIFVYIVLLAFSLWAFDSPNFHGEDDFFIRNIDLLELGKLPYKDFWFHFGPGLIYFPLLIKKLLGCLEVSTRTSYYLFFGLANIASLYLLYFITRRLTINQRYQNLLFGLAAMLQINFSMGIQYTLIRTLTPFGLMIILHDYLQANLGSKSVSKNLVTMLLPLALVALTFLFFIETALAFYFSLLVFLGTALCTNRDRKTLTMFLITLLGPVLFLMLRSPFFTGVLNYMSGGQNFPVFPSPPILFYLFSLFISLSLIFGGRLNNSARPLSYGLASLGLALMPGALGRSDTGHIFCYGIGVFILTAGIMAKFSDKAFKTYLAIFALIFATAWSLSLYSVGTGKVLASLYAKIGQHLLSDKQIIVLARKLGLDEDRSSRIIEYEKNYAQLDYRVLSKYRPLATPLLIDNRLYRYLYESKQFIPEYYLFTINVDTPAQLQRKISDLDKNMYLIVPKSALAGFYTKPDPEEENRFYSRIFFYPVRVPHDRAAPDMNRELIRHIVQNYCPVDEFGQYYIYRKRQLT